MSCDFEPWAHKYRKYFYKGHRYQCIQVVWLDPLTHVAVPKLSNQEKTITLYNIASAETVEPWMYLNKHFGLELYNVNGSTHLMLGLGEKIKELLYNYFL